MNTLGVDVGGTFTDFFYFRDGVLEISKLPSTPLNPADSILTGLRTKGWQPEHVVHGTTVATNTVLERSGSRVAFVTTGGFRDILQIGRQSRPNVYDLEPQRLPLIVPSELCFEASERIDFQGKVLETLDTEEIRRIVAAIEASAPEAVAVCLLFSFLNPDHEERLGEALRASGFEVSLSSDILPEPREYERAVSTVLSAYVAPKMKGYLSELESLLRAHGCEDLSVVQSSGGKLSAAQAGSLAAATLLSGPAAGVTGAFSVAQAAGFENLITFDMGGTSTDVCLCPGKIPRTSDWSISDLPVRLPAVDVHTVGAGGGSIAWLDEGGALRAGPSSAGADPGPAAYGRGGPATTTDAHLALGQLDESSFLGGDFAVNGQASVAALSNLGLGSAAEAARGVLTVANSVMEKALRLVSVERGFDPADFTLVAFGGAGPLHACELAQALGIRRILVPRHPGLMSAVGMVWAEAMRDYSSPLARSLGSDFEDGDFLASLRSQVSDLETRAREEMDSDAVLEPALDMRYAGQGFELTIPWTGGSQDDLLGDFHAEHHRLYGHADRDRVVETTTARLRARMPIESPDQVELPAGLPDPSPAMTGSRLVQLEATIEAPVYDRELLLADNRIAGPAIVSQFDSTTLVLPGWQAVVDRNGNLVMEET